MSNYEKISIGLQVLVGLVALITLWLYYLQLRAMSAQLAAMQEAAKAQSALSLVSFLQAPEVRSARQVVRQELSTKPLENWTDEERSAASKVVANYDVAAALLKAGVAPINLIASSWGPSIRHCHDVLAPYIAEQRQKPGGHVRYWSNFDWLTSEAARLEQLSSSE
jgi:hypothetical protein